MANQDDSQGQPAEAVGTVRNDAEGFRKIQNDTAGVGGVQQAAEAFRTVRHGIGRKESHTLTVREVARMFEAGGVARTERSVVNWCQLNSQGVARLDSYFDPNERKYFITPQSVEAAIAEEKAKAARGTPLSLIGTVTQVGEGQAAQQEARSEAVSEQAGRLEKEVMDLKILNSGKDFLIQQMRQERDSSFSQLLDASKKAGELETRLLQLSAPGENRNRPEPG